MKAEFKKIWAMLQNKDNQAELIEMYKNQVDDVVIYSKTIEDDTEFARWEYDSQMLERYNNHGAKAHLVEYKDAKHYSETWAQYEKRLDVEIAKIKRQRIAALSENPDFYRKYGRNLAKALAHN
jgi:hypothetical protein